MKGIVFALLAAAAPLAAADVASSVTDRMAQGKLAADLGDNAAATRAFSAVAEDRSAAAAVRIEALIRLGSARRSAGDHEGALKAFERASKDPALDRGTKALLVQALGGALPGSERWDAVWKDVTFVVDRGNAARPGLAIRWPDADQVKAEYKGEVVDLDIKDGDIVDVLRLFGDIGDVNVLIDPAVQGSVTIKLEHMPWEQALDAITTQRGLAWHRDDRVVSVSRSGRLPGTKRYTGEPITMDFKNGDLQDVMRLFSDISELNVVAGPGVGGKLSLKLHEVPWDQVFDLVQQMHGLSSRREGNVIWVTTGWMPPTRAWSGKPIDVDLKDKDLASAFDTIATAAGVEVAIDPQVQARLADPDYLGTRSMTLRLKQVPGDHALDLAARVSGLAVDRDGTRFTVRPLVRRRGNFRGTGGLASFGIGEVVVRGVVNRKSGGRLAFVLGPDNCTYFPGVKQQLLDGTITAIDATGVTFEQTQDGGGTRTVKKPIQGVDEAPAPVFDPSRSATVPAPSDPAPPGDLLRGVDTRVVAPRLRKRVSIAKPLRATAAKVTGTVILAVLVDKEGKPADVKLLQKIQHPLGQECNEAAVAAVKQMRWDPATKGGAPVQVWIRIKIPFSATGATVKEEQ